MGGGEWHSELPPEELDTISHGSMIEVVRTSEPTERLLYSKSSVYIHPSQRQSDNVKGCLALVARQQREVLVAFAPQDTLEGLRDELEQSELGDDQQPAVTWPSKASQYSFAVPLNSVYSILVHPPTITAWHGAIAINLFGGHTLPTLYFHDDQSASTVFTRESFAKAKKPSNNIPSWSGEGFIKKLRSYASVVRSTLEPSLFLLNPSKADLEVHSMPYYEDLPEQSGRRSDDDPIPRHLRPSKAPVKQRSILHQSLNGVSSTKQDNAPMDNLTFNVLNTLGRFTRSARTAAKEIARPILRHDLAKPILPHLPPPVANLAAEPSPEFTTSLESAGVRDYNQAAVFLAKWARQVAEEGERLRRLEVGASADGEEASALGAFEVLASTYDISRPRTSRAVGQPIVLTEWQAWFSPEDGRLLLSEVEAKRRIFQRGLDMAVRREAWPFLLRVYGWSSTASERTRIRQEKEAEYEKYKSEWFDRPEVTSTEAFVEERHRIEIDCRRTDRNQPLFSMAPDEEDLHVSPELEQRADYSGGQPPSNMHVRRLQEVLLTYNAFEPDEGYCQGMSDIASPIYITLDGDAVMTFWCFVAFMERMKDNFLRDQSGMKTQLSNLQRLIAVMDPAFYTFLEKTDSMNLFFTFRWILIGFKREFPLSDVLKIWENLMTDQYGPHFHLFIALAIMEAHRTIVMRYLSSFDEILKFFNELSMTMEAEPFLCQAEILYLTLKQIEDKKDRSRAYLDDLQRSSSDSHLRSRKQPSASTVTEAASLRDLL